MPRKYTDKGVTIRIKQKWSDYVETIANERDESFLDTVYYLFEFHKQATRTGVTPHLPSKSQSLTQSMPIKIESSPSKHPVTTANDDDLDFGDFE
jgi:hypothetical protein